MRGIVMNMKNARGRNLTFILVLIFLGACAVPAAEKPVLGTLTDLNGTIYVIRGSEKTAVKKGEKLYLGDVIETGTDGKATMTGVPGKSSVKLNKESVFFSEEKWKVPFFTLEQGQIRVSCSGLDRKFSVYCGDTFISGFTTEVDVACMGKGEHQLYVVSGKVWWEHTKFCTKKVLEKGDSVFWNAQGIPTVSKKKAEEIREKAQWIPFEGIKE